ncbi:hypothetical protein QYF61_024076, partial [Mycteria americana]
MKSSWRPVVYPRGQYWVRSCSTSSLMIWMMQSVPSTNLLMTQKWEEWLIRQRVMLPCRDLNRLKKWADRNLMQFIKGKYKVLHLRRNNCRHWYMQGTDWLESSFSEKDRRVPGGHHVEHEPAMYACGKKRLMVFWTSLRRLKGGCKEDGGRFFSVVPSDRTRDYGHTEAQEVPSEHQEKSFTVKVTKHWHRLPRKVVESPSSGILKSCLDIVLSNQLQVSLHEHG